MMRQALTSNIKPSICRQTNSTQPICESTTKGHTPIILVRTAHNRFVRTAQNRGPQQLWCPLWGTQSQRVPVSPLWLRSTSTASPSICPIACPAHSSVVPCLRDEAAQEVRACLSTQAKRCSLCFCRPRGVCVTCILFYCWLQGYQYTCVYSLFIFDYKVRVCVRVCVFVCVRVCTCATCI